MPATPVRIGLIGAGRIGASHASIIARRVPEATLVAVADLRPGAAANIAEPLGARGETPVDAVFSAGDIDAVVIAASSVAHAELIAGAAAAGKHVFSEKPAGMSLAEIRAGIDATASADSLTAPGHPSLLDHATVVVRYDNGAIATAEASFAAAYGYDVRGEVLGSAGMVTMGEGALSSMRLHDASGRLAATAHSDTALLIDAYTGELAEFAQAVAGGRAPSVTGEDAWAAFAVAQACIDSVISGARAVVAVEVSA